MKAVILAGGMGTRLMPYTLNTPKCLVKVNGKPIINYQLDVLVADGIKEVVIVLGHLKEQIIQHTQENYSDKINFQYVENNEYKDTQNAYSLWLAKDLLTSDPEGFVIFNSDLIFQKEMLTHLIDDDCEDGLIVDKCEDPESDMVNIRLDGNRILEMSKKLAPEHSSVEAVGPVKFSQTGGRKYFAYLEKYFNEHDKKNWLFYMLGDFGNEHDLIAVYNPGLPWAEVDDVNDLEKAQLKNILPR